MEGGVWEESRPLIKLEDSLLALLSLPGVCGSVKSSLCEFQPLREQLGFSLWRFHTTSLPYWMMWPRLRHFYSQSDKGPWHQCAVAECGEVRPVQNKKTAHHKDHLRTPKKTYQHLHDEATRPSQLSEGTGLLQLKPQPLAQSLFCPQISRSCIRRQPPYPSHFLHHSSWVRGLPSAVETVHNPLRGLLNSNDGQPELLEA
jgi:hypothetical protein